MGKLFDLKLVFTSIPELLEKLPITLELAGLAMVLGLLLGLLMAIINQKNKSVDTGYQFYHFRNSGNACHCAALYCLFWHSDVF